MSDGQPRRDGADEWREDLASRRAVEESADRMLIQWSAVLDRLRDA